jgi:DNA-binding response OmpR family regulator
MTATQGLPGLLLVEADLLVRAPLAEYLRECGYRVLEARDADEARRLMGSAHDAIDIVLSDARGTPDETGFGLAHWLRQHHPGVEIILTGRVEDMARKAADVCEDGPETSPPYDHRILLDRIRRMTAGRDRRRAG